MKAIQNLIRQREKMLWRIRNKVTPDVVNAEFRAALNRYNNRQTPASEGKPLTRETLEEAVRKLRDRAL